MGRIPKHVKKTRTKPPHAADTARTPNSTKPSSSIFTAAAGVMRSQKKNAGFDRSSAGDKIASLAASRALLVVARDAVKSRIAQPQLQSLIEIHVPAPELHAVQQQQPSLDLTSTMQQLSIAALNTGSAAAASTNTRSGMCDGATLLSLAGGETAAAASGDGRDTATAIIAQLRRILECTAASTASAQQKLFLCSRLDDVKNGEKAAEVRGNGLAADSSHEAVAAHNSLSTIGLDHLSLADGSGSTHTDNSFAQQLLQTSSFSFQQRGDAILTATLSFNDAAAQTPCEVDSFAVNSDVYDGVLAFLLKNATSVIQDPLRLYAFVVVDSRERMLFAPLCSDQSILINLFTPSGTAELQRTTREVGRLLNLIDPLRLAWTTVLLGLRYAARKYHVHRLFLDCVHAGLPLRKWQQTPHDLNEGICVVAADFCQRMADFVDALPGVCRLPPDDRRVLTRSSMCLGWAALKSFMFERNECFLLLGNGARYNLEWMEFLIGPDVAAILCRTCGDMNSMQLTFAERCLFTAVMILYEKQLGITAAEAILQLKEHYWRALEFLVHATALSPEKAREKLEHVQRCLLYCDELCNFCLPRIESYSFERPFGRREVPQVLSEQFFDIGSV